MDSQRVSPEKLKRKTMRMVCLTFFFRFSLRLYKRPRYLSSFIAFTLGLFDLSCFSLLTRERASNFALFDSVPNLNFVPKVILHSDSNLTIDPHELCEMSVSTKTRQAANNL